MGGRICVPAVLCLLVLRGCTQRRDNSRESDWPGQPQPISSLLNQSRPRSPGWGGEESRPSHTLVSHLSPSWPLKLAWSPHVAKAWRFYGVPRGQCHSFRSNTAEHPLDESKRGCLCAPLLPCLCMFSQHDTFRE